MEEDVYIARLQMPEIRTLNPKRNQRDEATDQTRPGQAMTGWGSFASTDRATDDRQCDLSWRRNIFRTWLNWKRRRRRHRAGLGGKGDMHILWHCGIYISGCPSSGLNFFFCETGRCSARESERSEGLWSFASSLERKKKSKKNSPNCHEEKKAACPFQVSLRYIFFAANM